MPNDTFEAHKTTCKEVPTLTPPPPDLEPMAGGHAASLETLSVTPTTITTPSTQTHTPTSLITPTKSVDASEYLDVLRGGVVVTPPPPANPAASPIAAIAPESQPASTSDDEDSDADEEIEEIPINATSITPTSTPSQAGIKNPNPTSKTKLDSLVGKVSIIFICVIFCWEDG